MPEDRQSGPFETELVLKLSVPRRCSPGLAVGGQQEAEDAEERRARLHGPQTDGTCSCPEVSPTGWKIASRIHVEEREGGGPGAWPGLGRKKSCRGGGWGRAAQGTGECLALPKGRATPHTSFSSMVGGINCVLSWLPRPTLPASSPCFSLDMKTLGQAGLLSMLPTHSYLPCHTIQLIKALLSPSKNSGH